MATSLTAYADSMESAYQNANSSKVTNKLSVTPDPVNPGTGTMPGGASKNTPANDQTGASKDSLVKGSTKTPTPSDPAKGGTSNPYTPLNPDNPTPSNPTNLPTGGDLDPQKYEPSPGTPTLPTGGDLDPQKFEPSPGTPTLPTGGDLDPQKFEPSPGTPTSPTQKKESVVGDTYTYEDFVREAQEAKAQQEKALSMVKDLPDNLVPDQVKSGQYTWAEWLDFAQKHPSIPWNVKFNQWQEEMDKISRRTGGALEKEGFDPKIPTQPEQPTQPTSGTGSVSVIGSYRLPVDIESFEPEVRSAIERTALQGGGVPRALDSGTLSQEDYERFMQGKMSLDEIRNIIVPAFREGFKASMPERPTPTENPTGGDLEPEGYEPSPGTPNPPTGGDLEPQGYEPSPGTPNPPEIAQQEPIGGGGGESGLSYPASPAELPDELIPEQVKSGKYSWDQWVNMMRNNPAAPWNVQYRAWQAEQGYQGTTQAEPSPGTRYRASQQGELVTPFQNYSLTTYHVPDSNAVTTTTKFPDELHVPQNDLSLTDAKTLQQVLYGSGNLVALENGTLSRDDWDRFRYGNMSEEDVRRYILPALKQGVVFYKYNVYGSPYSTQANQAELMYQRAQSSTPVKSGSFSL